MGKRDSGLTWEVWLHKVVLDKNDDLKSDTWHQILDGDTPVFSNKERAMAVAGSYASHEHTAEVKVVERREVMSLNGVVIVPPPSGPRSPMLKNPRTDKQKEKRP